MIAQTVAWLQVVIMVMIMSYAAVILYKLIFMDLTTLICEPDGKASLSRFQMLLFTFVIASLFMALSLENGDFINLPVEVLGLLGISGGSYLISKGIGKKPPEPKKPDPEV